MDDIISLQWQVQLLICPIYSFFGWRDLPPKLLLLSSIKYLQFCIVCHIIFLHPLRDTRLEVPTYTQSFIPSEVNIAIRERGIDIFHNLIDQIISGFKSWIELASIHKITPHNIFMIFIASTPRMSVGGSIDLDYYSCSFQLGVVYYFLNLFGRVCSADLAELTQFRDQRDLQREAVLVNNMPMKNIHLIKKQSIYCFLYCSYRQKMSRRINHQSSPFELRLVINHNRNSLYDIASILLQSEQL